MDLNELKKRLYKQDDGIEERPVAPDVFAPGNETPDIVEAAPQWSSRDARKFAIANWSRKIFWLFGAVVILAVGAVAAWFFLLGGNSFDRNSVALEIFGQERIVAGEEVNYIVRYRNNTKDVLNDVVLSFIYPEQTLPIDEQNLVRQGKNTVSVKNLGQLVVGQEAEAEFRARVFGDKDSQQQFFAKLIYRPAGYNSDFANEVKFASVVISVPLVLNFDLPERLVSGQTINFTLKYLNTSDVAFDGSKIQLEYPAGFVFDSAFPSPSEGNNIWQMAEISSREEGKIIIKGTLSGNEGESKIFKAKVGIQKGEDFVAYAETLSSPEISVSPLFVEQILNSKPDSADLTASLSETLDYKLKYRNTTSVAIGPVVISVKIDSQAVDWTSISANSGFFSSVDNTIIWNASSLSGLNSLDGHQEGELGFSLRLKDKLPINSFTDKNFTVVTTAQIDSPNVPLSLVGTQLRGVNKTEVKINSRLTLNVRGLYADSLFQNSGPLPPRVGQRTTYTIYFQLLNVSNDLSPGSLTVEASLPSYIQWLGPVYPAGEDIRYSQATGKVIWRIDKLSAGTGILSPVRQVAFQIALIPSISQIGNLVELVKSAQASGQDSFTLKILKSEEKTLMSDLPGDPAVGLEKGRVVN